MRPTTRPRRRTTIAIVMFLLPLLVLPLLVPPASGAAEAQRLSFITTVNLPITLPLLVGLRHAAQDGITVDVREVRESEAAVLAVAQGQGQIGNGYYAFFPAVERGAKIVALMELAKPAFVLLARKDITDVKTLNGMQVATHSAKSSQKVLFDFFFARDYAGVKPVWTYMPAGSPARAEALLSGAVKAATMDISAASTVMEKAPGQFHTLIDTTKVPVSNFFLIASRDFVAKNAPTLTTVVKRILESYRQGAADPTYWVRERGDYFKETPTAKLEADMRDLVRVYDLNGGIDRLRGKDGLANIDFQIASANLGGPLSKWTPDAFFDPSILASVLKQLGTR